MCGIAGIFSTQQDATSLKEAASKLTKALKHRGPDHQSIWQEGQLALCHTRLKIIDLSDAANQPMLSHNSHLAIVFNGEIFNHLSLKKELEQKGHRFFTTSDTEVVINAYLEWGTSCFQRFDGFFALAIYDARRQEMVLARDPLGKKPLFYSLSSGSFAFASEADALKQLIPQLTYSMKALNHFLALGYILCPLTIYEQIKQLEAGSFAFIDLQTLKLDKHAYFKLETLFAESPYHTVGEVAEELDHILNRSVQKRLLADVEIGTLLSGGIDSSIITAIASESIPHLKTFNAGFQQSAYDESKAAEACAKYLNTHHHTVAIAYGGLAEVKDAIRHLDQMLGDNSYLSFLKLSAFAAQHVKVVLSGDGADELFLGYPTYQADLLNARLNYWQRGIVKRFGLRLARIMGNNAGKAGMRYRWWQFVNGINDDFRKAHYNWRLYFNAEERISVLGEQHRQLVYDTDPAKHFLALYAQVEDLPKMKQHQFVDIKTWLENDILVKIDRASMQHGLEVRSPFLDMEVVKLALSLPEKLLIKDGKGKLPVRALAAKLLPANIAQRKKEGFNSPVNHWLNDHIGNEFNKYVNLVFQTKYQKNSGA